MMQLYFKSTITTVISQIKSSDIGHRMAVGAFWSLTGTACAKLIVLIAGIFCARILGKEAYGEFGMVRSTINMFVVFGYAGLGLTATKYISEFLKTHIERIPSIYILTNGFAFCTGIIVTAIVLILAPYLATNTLHCPELTNAIRVGAVLLFVTVINGAQNGVLSGLEDFKSIALNTLVGSIAETVFMLLGAYKFGVMGAVLGYGLGFIVLYITNHISIRSKFRQLNIVTSRKKINKADVKILYKFSLPAALSSIMVMPAFWVVRSILVQHNGFGELAIYEAAEQWRTIILFIPAAVSQIVLPILSSLANTEISKFWKVLKINMFLNGGIAFAIAMVICLSSGFIMNFYGEGFGNGLPLIILSISTIFSSVANVIGLSISSRAKMWMGLAFNTLWAIIFVGLTKLFLINNFGAVGISWALLCSYGIQSVLQYLYLIKARP